MNEESYSNPLKKKARVSLYTKTSPNNPLPPPTSPYQSDQLLTTGSTSSDSLLSSSKVVDLNNLNVNDLIPLGNKISDHRFTESSIPKPRHHQSDVSPNYLAKQTLPDTVMQKNSPKNDHKISSRPRDSHPAPSNDVVDDVTIPSPGKSLVRYFLVRNEIHLVRNRSE